jgi:UDP-2,3-diacylglucosamine pyrophosphatase LpxH
MIIIVSDVHLGYDKSDKDNFDRFIDSELEKLDENDHLVLLGDIVDFWRKNSIDVTVEYKKETWKGEIKTTNKEGLIIKKLYDLKKKKRIQVHYVVGNHDYSILYYSESS